MANRALGLIEVYGMLGAMVAADAALKAANVTLLGNRRVRGGLTTVELLGDVAAIRASVEAGVDAVKDLDCYVTSHVIARLDEQVERMLLQKYETKQQKEEVEEPEEPEEEKAPEREEPGKKESQPLKVQPETLETLKKEHVDSPEETILEAIVVEQVERPEPDASTVLQVAELEKMKVTELRSLAYQRNIETLTKKEIKFANKTTLIDALLEEGVRDE